jgi:hypothetical protein
LNFGTPDTFIDVSGDHAYLGSFGGELHIFDVKDPARPTFVTSHPVGGFITSLQTEGRHLYLTTGQDLRAFDLSKPERPQLAGMHALERRPSRVRVANNHAYVCTWTDLLIFEIRFE